MLRVNNSTPRPVSSAASFGSVVRLGNTPYVFCFLATLKSENGTGIHAVYFGIPEDSQSHQFQFLSCPVDEFDSLFTVTEGDSAPEIQRLLANIFDAMARQIGTTNV